MMLPLANHETKWVEKIMRSISIEQCIGHMMLPYYPGEPSDWSTFDEQPPTVEEWTQHLEKYPLGAIYLREAPTDESREKLKILQDFSEIP